MGCACQLPVGASLLAKNLRAPRAFRIPASSLTFFASKRAPTVGFRYAANWSTPAARTAPPR
ncbi:hypothetical protein BFW90_08500 [Pseudomonas fluorescens]|nr:hypothetical protein BFW90_08500 [Pseudomonas fluorescens]